MERREYPIVEFDGISPAYIEPKATVKAVDMPERCVPCFFRDVIDPLTEAGRLRPICAYRTELGVHTFYELDTGAQRIAVYQPGLGAPMAAMLLEAAIAFGARKFVACGGAGNLRKDLYTGHVIIPVSAVRDEGTSYHYLPPSREVEADPDAVAAIEAALKSHGLKYVAGKTWTTDGVYRETHERTRIRREEGCLAVEMECAAFFAVARYRGAQFGQLLYSGDDLSGAAWDPRHCDDRASTREKLFWLAVAAVERL